MSAAACCVLGAGNLQRNERARDLVSDRIRVRAWLGPALPAPLVHQVRVQAVRLRHRRH